MSENSFGGSVSPSDATPALAAGAYTMCVSGSYAPPVQLVPPMPLPMYAVPSQPVDSARLGGLNIGPNLYRSVSFIACACNSGVKSIRSSGTLICCRAYAGGLVGNGCVGDVFSPGTVD